MAKHNQSMEPLKLPSEEDIRNTYDQGKEAVVMLFTETIGALVLRIQKLEDQIAKNSCNSSKPPLAMG